MALFGDPMFCETSSVTEIDPVKSVKILSYVPAPCEYT